jgi:pimeloyl-ACP methyl ester carboxylesterase
VAANGARFHVAECGDGPLVLLLHGFPEFWWAWRHQLPALAAAGYRAVAMDLRGYGGSDKTPRGYDPTTVSGDVTGVIRSLGETRAVVVGHGWGGWAAWATAGLRPTNVRAVAVLAMAHPRRLRATMLRPAQVRAGGYLIGYQSPVLPERALIADDAVRVERLLRSWSAPGSAFPSDEEARRYRAAMGIWPASHCALEYHRWAVRSVPRLDGRRFYRRMGEPVRVPVLHLQGSLDPTMLPATARGSGEYVAGEYTWHELAGVGHFPHEEAPELVTGLLAQWLAGLP